MFEGLRDAFNECDRNAGLRCVVIRGAGGRAFSAGADISEFETVRGGAAQAREYAKIFHAAAEGAPLSARWHKIFIYRLLDPKPSSDAKIAEGFECFDTQDFQAGCKSFLAKQDPVFISR